MRFFKGSMGFFHRAEEGQIRFPAGLQFLDDQAAETIQLALGAADITAQTGAITPRRDLKQTDFKNSLWWVGDRSDGGLVAIELKNALSTGGFSLKTTKNGKGQISLELTGHVSISAQDVVPMVFYSVEG